MKLAIYGYGNLGKGVEQAILQNPDATLVGIFTRRDPAGIRSITGAPVYAADRLPSFVQKIDVLILCGGSATDLPVMTPALARSFNVVDSFDTHADIPAHFQRVDEAARAGDHIALISAGWDPGLFSVNRLYAQAMLPEGKDYTFWGKGVSQGHSDAIRRIDGVEDARQYTVPIPRAVERVRNGEQPDLTTGEKHTRECFVVAREGADLEHIEREIKTMPAYFADYETTVHFVSAQTLEREHKGLPHGGFVLRTGKTGVGRDHDQLIEYRLKLDSNPEFTGSALVAFARGLFKQYCRGVRGCRTVLDLAPADLSAMDEATQRATLL